jgi:oligoribonuclease (3'-5' exoribonuclease)
LELQVTKILPQTQSMTSLEPQSSRLTEVERLVTQLDLKLIDIQLEIKVIADKSEKGPEKLSKLSHDDEEDKNE